MSLVKNIEHTTKYTVLILFLFLSLAAGYLLQATAAPKARAQGLTPEGEPDIECIAQGVAEYMNEIIGGAGSLTQVKLLSPTFNMTSEYFHPLVNAMARYGARFRSLYGISGNSYNAFGKPITEHVDLAMSNGSISGMQLFLAETGNYDTTDTFLLQGELRKIKGKQGQNYIGGALFNAFNTNPEFPHGILSDEQIEFVCDGNCGVIGVNSAAFFSRDDGFYNRARDRNMQFALSIANGGLGSLGGVKADIGKMYERKINPVIRIWTDGGGFEDPQTYITFLNDINSYVNSIENSTFDMTVYAIAGPNEPESDPWSQRSCKQVEERKKFEPKDVPCDQVSDPEFHKYRPYPASPCNRSIEDTAKICSNELVVKQGFERTRGQCTPIGGNTYECTVQGAAELSVNLDESEFPILGNTELVPNFINSQNLLDFKTRVNEYVGWYLHGALNVSTEDHNTNPDDILSYSGPLNKLLPQTRQFAKRNETVQEGTDGEVRHNQVVGCTSHITQIPLVNTETLIMNCLVRNIANFFVFDKYYLSDWAGKPVGGLPRGSEFAPVEESYPNSTEWLRGYKSWRGFSCSPWGTPLICFPDFESWNSKLFTYIPYTSTEDRKGNLVIKDDQLYGSGEPQLIGTPTFTTPSNDPRDRRQEVLYFAHTEEVAEAAELLQRTYVSKDKAESSAENSTESDKKDPRQAQGCMILDVRTNPGDDLYAEYDEPGPGGTETLEPGLLGTLNYEAKFTCEFPDITSCINQCDLGPLDQYGACLQACQNQSTCRKDVLVSIPMESNVPLMDEIWHRLVEGDMGVFKRFYPKFGPDAPIEQVVDIPGVTSGEYLAVGPNVTALAGDPSQNKPGSNAEIYFPHLGGVSEYFLNGIQTALRPKGFANQPLAGVVTPPSTTPGTGIPGDSAPEGPADIQPSATCALIEGGKPYCSWEYLAQSRFFGNESDAKIASRICHRESRGDPGNDNYQCPDYSIGLFQINLLWHYIDHPTEGRIYCYKGFVAPGVCSVVDQSILDKCTEYLRNPINNIKKAVELKNSPQSWNHWSAYKADPQCRNP